MSDQNSNSSVPIEPQANVASDHLTEEERHVLFGSIFAARSNLGYPKFIFNQKIYDLTLEIASRDWDFTKRPTYQNLESIYKTFQQQKSITPEKVDLRTIKTLSLQLEVISC